MKHGKQILQSVCSLFTFFLLSYEVAHGMGSKPQSPPTAVVDGLSSGGVYEANKAYSFRGSATNGVDKVVLALDSNSLVTVPVAGDRFQGTITFPNHLAGARTLSVIGYQGANPVVKNDFSVTVRAVSTTTTLQVEGLVPNKQILVDTTTLFRIAASVDVKQVKVSMNGTALGTAEFNNTEKKFRFSTSFSRVGEFDLTFAGFDGTKTLISKTYRVVIVPKSLPPQSDLFNSYLLKASDHINRNYGLLGYNINAQLTHDLNYHRYGVLKSTMGSLTMCVSAMLEVIITAFDMYARETGDYTVFEHLPFESWNNLRPTSIKAHIWVDSKLGSYGTSDALRKFGMGESIPFSQLKPGAFINFNRTNKTGHAVIFISYLDKAGNELQHYDASRVAGFKYFSAQGQQAVGKGGFSYRYAFFSKNGCPSVPYYRDCGIIYSDSQRMFTTGHMWHPKNWRKVSSSEIASSVRAMEVPMSEEEIQFFSNPSRFNGLTTDDVN